MYKVILFKVSLAFLLITFLLLIRECRKIGVERIKAGWIKDREHVNVNLYSQLPRDVRQKFRVTYGYPSRGNICLFLEDHPNIQINFWTGKCLKSKIVLKGEDNVDN